MKNLIEILQIYFKENFYKLKILRNTLLFFRLCIFFIYIDRRHNVIQFYDWVIIDLLSAEVRLGIVLDSKSIFFSSVVLLIRGRVLGYSMDYMRSEKFFWRFIRILCLFVFSIVVIIFRSNFILILLGWDGLGVRSYFLVIYFQNKNSLNSGILTAITNRLGDVGIVILLSLFTIYGSWDFIIYSLNNYKFSSLFLILLFLSISTKRAQVPFSAWLPAAIAAPTPVSSLVHSSTLVTAGVYLLMRILRISPCSRVISWFVFVGLTSIVIRFLASLFEKDLKKIIALSTLRHLGFIVILIGINNINVAFLHLVIHAFFKALLFMTIGIVIHCRKNYQRFNVVRSMLNVSKLNSSIMVISIISLTGLPFLRGFYSKDSGLEEIYNLNINFLLWVSIILIRITSIIYSSRILINLVFSSGKVFRVLWIEDKNLRYKNMLILIVIVIVIGNYLQVKNFLGFNFSFFSIFLKIIIPTIFLAFLLFRNYFFSLKVFSHTIFTNFCININFLSPLSNFFPSFLSKTFSSTFINSQDLWVEIYSTKIVIFWEKIFFMEKKISRNFYFCLSRGLVFVGALMTIRVDLTEFLGIVGFNTYFRIKMF